MIDQDEAHELRMDVRKRNQYERDLARHPDPRDPDYPGDDDDEGEE